MSVANLTMREILEKIHNAKDHIDLFGEINTLDELKKIYKKIMNVAHPDRGVGDDYAVKVNNFYSKYLDYLDEKENNIITISVITDKKRVHAFKYYYKAVFELGTIYYGKNYILYVIPKEHKSFIDNAKKHTNSIRYMTEDVEKIYSRYIPKISDLNIYEYEDNYYISIKKTPDVYGLDVMFDKLNKTLDVRHIAWITTRLCGLLCLLRFNGLSHNGINLQNCLVSPEYHTILLFGGWWYTTKLDDKLIGMVSDDFSVLPFTIQRDKVAQDCIDILHFKNIIKELNKGTYDGFPEPMKNFMLREHSDVIDMYEDWEEVLIESFGERKFIKLDFRF